MSTWDFISDVESRRVLLCIVEKNDTILRSGVIESTMLDCTSCGHDQHDHLLLMCFEHDVVPVTTSCEHDVDDVFWTWYCASHNNLVYRSRKNLRHNNTTSTCCKWDLLLRNTRHAFKLQVDVQKQVRKQKWLRCCTILLWTKVYYSSKISYCKRDLRNPRHTFKLPVDLHVQKQDRKQKWLRCCTEQFRTKR